ncbi:alpha-E domain-containing protein [Paenibacillus sp. IB182496]|uniref:Alpha-E domain-containing protein n=1 Tax=Paenibacillus sabuli TaxID=2772509 RepID=A0A927BS46_9BACL|nr:alpha-E domain-containing protein [Paenibacillus sabuli]MBD2845772.1 alpha-E domain-containing protein [Paenibacillus sabuli]
MLNRNAEALFWVGRYMERAENHARLLDVHYHVQQEGLAEDAKEVQQGRKWARIVDALGSRQAYEQQYGASYTEADVLHYVTLDRDHPNSLVCCVNYARGNLRTLREKVPSEMWDVVNGFYLWLREQRQEELQHGSPHEFYQRIKEWAALFLGTSQSVMPRENEWHFIECGRYLERSENTLRILLSIRNACMDEALDTSSGGYAYLQAVLKSVSGYQAFRRYYADNIAIESINEFLVLHPAFPRSVYFAMHQMEDHLRGIGFQDAQLRAAHGKIIRQAGKTIAELSCLEREDLAGDPGGEIVAGLLHASQVLGEAFAKTFFRMGEASA